MFPFTYVKIIIVIAVLSFASFSGWYVEHLRFVNYQTQVEALGKQAEIKNESIKKQNELVTENVKNDYKNKLDAVHNYYAGMHVNPSIGAVSSVSNSSTGTDAAPSYNVLAEQCTGTTLQAVELIDWINKQLQIK